MSTPLPSALDLAPFEVAVLDHDDATICALDGDLRITYVNRAWCAFSSANGGSWGEGRWKEGVALLDAVPRVLTSYYEELFARARTSLEPTEHSYECSSPTTFRLFRMRIFRCKGDALVVSHSLARAVLRQGAQGPALEHLYRDAAGIVLQCSHCRRVRLNGGERRWEWVAEYVARAPPNTSHGLCPLCVAYHHSIRAPPGPSVLVPTGVEPRAILVVDADDTLRSLVARILRRAAYDVTEVGSSSEALQVVSRRAFDVLVCGPGTSTVDDVVAMGAIRATHAVLRYVVISGAGSSDVLVAVGTAVVLRAPFVPAALLDCVERALEPTD